MRRLSRMSKFHRGFGVTLLSDGLARSISAVMTVVLIRFLAVGDYAYLVVFLAVGQFVGSAATGGLRMLYVRTEAERVARPTVTELPFAAVLAGGVSIIVAVAATAFVVVELASVGPPAQRLAFVGLCAVFSVGQAIVDLVSYHHQAHLGFVRGGFVNIGRNVCLLMAAVVASVLLSASAPATAAALAGASLAAGIFASGRLLLTDPGQRRIRGTHLGFSRESAWLTLYSLVAAGFATVDVFIVAIIFSQRSVASFGAAQRYYAVALGAVPALEAVLRVRTAQPDIIDSSTAQVSALGQWMKRTALPMALVVAGLAIAARPAIPLIDHGRYPQSIPVFQVLLIGVFAYYLTMPSVNILMAQRRFSFLALAFGGAFAANALGDFVLGPRLGIVAIAAVATAVLVLLSAAVTVRAFNAPAGPARGGSLQRLDPRSAMTVVGTALICAVAGFAVARVHEPVLVIALVASVFMLAVIVIKWGELGIALLLVAATPLIPVVSGVYAQPKTYAGIDGSSLRTAAVAVLSIFALALRPRLTRRERTPVLRAVRSLLLALSGVGLVSALFTAVGPSEFIKQAAQAAGQPLFYAIAITMFADALSRFDEARARLLTAWCLAVIGEAIIVAGQVATGAAYDPVRGITRAQGSMGADALGAFAMFGVFGALTLRSVASTRFARRLSVIAVAASLGMMFLSLARGPVIAFALALVLIALPASGRWSQRQISAGFCLVALTGLTAYLTKGLWLARLTAPTTASFDRPATWIAGLRIVRAHPMFGVGVAHIVSVVQSSSQYAYTAFGANGAVPHNSWLFVAAANGLPYAGLLVVVTVVFIGDIYRSRCVSNRFLRAGLTGLLLVFFENNLFNHPEVMLFVLLASVVAVHDARPTASRVAALDHSFARPRATRPSLAATRMGMARSFPASEP